MKVVCGERRFIKRSERDVLWLNGSSMASLWSTFIVKSDWLVLSQWKQGGGKICVLKLDGLFLTDQQTEKSVIQVERRRSVGSDHEDEVPLKISETAEGTESALTPSRLTEYVDIPLLPNSSGYVQTGQIPGERSSDWYLTDLMWCLRMTRLRFLISKRNSHDFHSFHVCICCRSVCFIQYLMMKNHIMCWQKQCFSLTLIKQQIYTAKNDFLSCFLV